MSLKAILLVADGMADRPVKELHWKTPLEVASKPALNHVAKTGICGLVDPISPGVPPGSDTATLAMLGYDPLKVYSGRGALEAVGSGISVPQGDVAFRCNFATVDADLTVIDRRAGRIANEDASRLAKSLQKVRLANSQNAKFMFKNTVQHRAVLVIHGSHLSRAVSDSDPEETGKKVLTVKPLDESGEAERTARIANALVCEFGKALKKHPVNLERARSMFPVANAILLRGAGTIPKIVSLKERFAINSACVGAVSLIKGVCKVAGMEVVDVKGATGTPQTDYLAKARATIQALETHDFVFLHVKATDVASHDRNARLKIKVIEEVDKMLSYILEHTDSDSTYLTVTADHTTSVVTGNHEGDPVPVAITGPYIRRDDVAEYDERSVAEGGLNRIRGMDLMFTLTNLLGKAKKFGS